MRTAQRLFSLTISAFLAGSITAANPRFVAAAANANLPSAVLEQVPAFHQVGKGTHSYFGLKVYHVTLWATGARWNPDQPHALDLESNRAISRDQLTAAGMDEMTRLGLGSPHQLQAWRAEMDRLLPSVKQGDQLVIFCAPNHKTSFFYNGHTRGDISDPAFGPAFFSIWLDPRAKNAALRKSLLNH